MHHSTHACTRTHACMHNQMSVWTQPLADGGMADLMMTHWFSVSINMFLYMLSVNAHIWGGFSYDAYNPTREGGGGRGMEGEGEGRDKVW